MKKNVSYLAAILLILSVVTVVLAILGSDKGIDMYRCVQDSDCVSVQQGCCGCYYGGKATAINKKHQDSWKDTISSQCGQRACLTVISNDPSCFKEPKCVSGACRLV